MKIIDNPIAKTILLKDGVKTRSFINKTLMVLTVVNAILYFNKGYRTGDNVLMIVWLVLGIACVVLGWFLIFKKSNLELIPVAMIVGLKERNYWGKKHYFLQLKNGKQRELTFLETSAEMRELKRILSVYGI